METCEAHGVISCQVCYADLEALDERIREYARKKINDRALDAMIPPTSQPYLCPVCNGRGIVQGGFYTVPAGQVHPGMNAGPEQCRSCEGKGIIR